LHTGGHAEPAQDVAHVHAGGLAADVQRGADFRVGLSFADQLQYGEFPIGPGRRFLVLDDVSGFGQVDPGTAC
jgi:hypothetical protein